MKCIKLALFQTTYHFNISFSIAMRSSSGIVELRSVCPVKLLHNSNSEFDNTSEDKKNKTRMHSSRMHTARSSSRHGGKGGLHTLPWSRPPWNRHPPEQAPPPPARSPSTSPLAVGLDQIPLNFPLGCGPGNLQGMLGYHPPRRPAARHAGIPPAMHAGIALPL